MKPYTLTITGNSDEWAILLNSRIVISGSMADIEEAREALAQLNIDALE